MQEHPLPRSVSPAQVIALIGIGIFLWFLGVLFLRWASAGGWMAGTPQMIIYALIIPVTWPLVRFAPQVVRLPATETLFAASVMSMTALLIDGIIIGYTPFVYATDPALARACAGGLLWAVGVAMALGLVLQPRRG